MSRPDRPYRLSLEVGQHTMHRDFATKAARYEWAQGGYGNAYRLTTVTNRKPVKRGEPACWLNLYANGVNGWGYAYATRDEADQVAASDRTHCIPVYLPGEGAESPGQQVDSQLARMAGDAREEVTRLKVERDGHRAAEARMRTHYENLGREFREYRDEKGTEVERLRADLEKTASEAKCADAEVQRLTRLSEILARDTAENAAMRREVERLTKELAAAKELTDDRIQEHRNQAFAAGQRMALADVRQALGIKEES